MSWPGRGVLLVVSGTKISASPGWRRRAHDRGEPVIADTQPGREQVAGHALPTYSKSATTVHQITP